MKSLRAVRSLLCLMLTLSTAGTLAAPTRVFIVPSKDGGPYTEVVQSIQSGIDAQHRAGLDLRILPLGTLRDVDPYVYRPALIVTIGVEAAQRVARLNPPGPILHTLLPRETALEILKSGRSIKPSAFRDAAIYLDQPVKRQLSLINLALPKHKRVAVLLGPATRDQENELRTAARARSLKVDIETIDKREQLLPKLEKLLDNNDILLSVAEPLAYHSETIHHVLLTTYRYKIPMVGLSKRYIEAGALMAVYSTPEQIGREVAELVSSGAAFRGGLSGPAAPKYFSVAINQRVADSLDLYLESETTLQRKLEALAR